MLALAQRTAAIDLEKLAVGKQCTYPIPVGTKRRDERGDCDSAGVDKQLEYAIDLLK